MQIKDRKNGCFVLVFLLLLFFVSFFCNTVQDATQPLKSMLRWFTAVPLIVYIDIDIDLPVLLSLLFS